MTEMEVYLDVEETHTVAFLQLRKGSIMTVETKPISLARNSVMYRTQLLLQAKTFKTQKRQIWYPLIEQARLVRCTNGMLNNQANRCRNMTNIAAPSSLDQMTRSRNI